MANWWRDAQGRDEDRRQRLATGEHSGCCGCHPPAALIALDPPPPGSLASWALCSRQSDRHLWVAHPHRGINMLLLALWPQVGDMGTFFAADDQGAVLKIVPEEVYEHLTQYINMRQT